MENFKQFEENIGYSFKDKSLLKHALTHSSFSNEMKINSYGDNERLEFLGDALLEAVSSEFLFTRYDKLNEGKLSKMRAALVCEQALAISAREIDLGSHLFLGKGEELCGGRERDSILSDALEAVFAAIFLDGGFEEVRRVILKTVLSNIETKQLFIDSKTILQEMAQKDGHGLVQYELICAEGPQHMQTFTSRVIFNGIPMEEGKGKNKKMSEQQAAYLTIQKLNKRAK